MKNLAATAFSALALIAILILGSAAPVHATLLGAGGTVAPSPEVGAFTTLASTGTLAFSFVGNTGTVSESVGTFSLNPFGTSDMTFEYKFSVSGGQIEHLSGASFGSFLTDVGFDATSGTNIPLTANRTSDGTVVEFNFSPSVTTGESSVLLIVNTNATTFVPGSIGLIDGGGQTLNGFAPAVPEPGTLTMFGTGLLGLAGLIRRKLVRA